MRSVESMKCPWSCWRLALWQVQHTCDRQWTAGWKHSPIPSSPGGSSTRSVARVRGTDGRSFGRASERPLRRERCSGASRAVSPGVRDRAVGDEERPWRREARRPPARGTEAAEEARGGMGTAELGPGHEVAPCPSSARRALRSAAETGAVDPRRACGVRPEGTGEAGGECPWTVEVRSCGPTPLADESGTCRAAAESAGECRGPVSGADSGAALRSGDGLDSDRSTLPLRSSVRRGSDSERTPSPAAEGISAAGWDGGGVCAAVAGARSGAASPEQRDAVTGSTSGTARSPRKAAQKQQAESAGADQMEPVLARAAWISCRGPSMRA